MAEREFAVAIEVVYTVDRDDWNIVTQAELQEILNRVALNAVGAIREHNPGFKVKRLQAYDGGVWVGGRP